MNKLMNDKAYKAFFTEVKEQIKRSQIKAALSVNASLINLYWQLGQIIVDKQKEYSWGKSVIEQLSRDLKSAFPDSSGFSARNLYDTRRFFLFYSSENILQAASQFSIFRVQEPGIPVHDLVEQPAESEVLINLRQVVAKIPWGHNVLILNKVNDPPGRSFLYTTNH